MTDVEKLMDLVNNLVVESAALGVSEVANVDAHTKARLIEDAKKAHQALRTAIELALSARVPAGWKLVPVEPTTAMADAGGSAVRTCYRKEYGDRKPGEMMCNYVYRAMLNAAPQPPAQREWVDLTDEQIEECFGFDWSGEYYKGWRAQAYNAIKAKLRERNGGGK